MSDAASDAGASPELEPLRESEEHETRMTYDPSSRVPFYVIAVWAVALTALAAYFVTYLVADLRLWGSP